MLAFNVKKKRFSLLYLEENELYVQDLTGSCSFPDPSTDTRKTEKGKIHLCSKSIIFEANNPNIPIYKFQYKDMKKEPKRSLEIFNEKHKDSSLQKLFDKKHTSVNDEIIFEMKRIVEINTSGPPSPYVVRDVTQCEINIIPAYENIEKLVEKITKLIEFSRSTGMQSDPQEDLNRLIIADSKLKFNMSYLESVTERPLLKSQMIAKRILPLVSIPGVFYVTNYNIYFQSLHSVIAKPVKIIHLSDIVKLFRRRNELRQIGLEIYTNKKSYYFVFGNNNEREEVYNTLINTLGKEFDLEMKLDHVMEKWQREEISNYEYLMFLNEAADRTFSDLTQYPVFPWVIADYNSPSIDLNNKDIYRDLTKPIGALNPDRLNHLVQRYQGMSEPRYIYGTHYSAPGYVIGYLVRRHPQYMLKLQSGKFDKPDRMFFSMKKDWNNIINNHAIVKEAIPEFYGSDEGFLVNSMKLDLGVRQNGKRVNDVKLPKWAKDPRDYLKMNRAALESKYVSDNLQHWIDLIFGYKQRGPDAVTSHNVFHYLTYEGAVDLDAISDPMERVAITLQINEFGQTPRQLFKRPHPPKHDFKAKIMIAPRKTSAQPKSEADDHVDSATEIKEQKDHHETSEEAKTESPKPNKPAPNQSLEPVKSESDKTSKNKEVAGDSLWEGKTTDKVQIKQVQKVHKSEISAILELPDERALTIGYDGFVKITQIKDMSVSRSFKVCDLSLSSIVQLKENELYALGSWDNNVYVFNLNYGTRVFSEALHNDAISQILYDANKSLFFTGSWDCSVRSWGYKGGVIDTSSEELLAEMNSQVTKMELSNNGGLLLFGDLEGNIQLVDLKSHQTLTTFAIDNERITSLRFLNDKQIVATGETCVKLFDLSGKEFFNMPIGSSLGTIVDMEVDAGNLIIATDKGLAGVYDILQQKRIGAFGNVGILQDGDVPADYEFTCMKIMNDGKKGMFGAKTGALTLAYYP